MASRGGYVQLVDESESSSSSRRQVTSSGDKKSKETSRLVGGQVQNVKSKNVYVFSDGTVADHEDDPLEMNEMTQRIKSSSNQPRSYSSTGSSSQYADVITKEIPIENTDTLQGLSIKFRCPVPELKRINGLYTDNEFYALSTIKIPVRSHQSMLQQELDKVAKEREQTSADILAHRAKCAADIVSSEVSDDDDAHGAPQPRSVMDMVELHSDPEDEESYSLLDRGWAAEKSLSSKTANNSKSDKRKFDKIINRKDEELKEIMEKVQRQANAVDEVTAVMRTSPSLMPPQTRARNCLNTISLSVPCLVVTILLIIIILPLMIWWQVAHTHSSDI